MIRIYLSIVLLFISCNKSTLRERNNEILTYHNFSSNNNFDLIINHLNKLNNLNIKLTRTDFTANDESKFDLNHQIDGELFKTIFDKSFLIRYSSEDDNIGMKELIKSSSLYYQGKLKEDLNFNNPLCIMI